MKLKAVSLTKDKEEFDKVVKTLSEKFSKLNIVLLDEYVNEENQDLYYWLKSYRSNLTEGNTTTDDSFTKIIFNEDNDILYSNTYDEQYEIINLKRAYELFSLNVLNINTIQAVNRVLGNNIFKNKFIEYRGRFRTNRVYIPFTKSNVKYEVEFTKYDDIKLELDKLINYFLYSSKDSIETIFALCIILHNELIGIHPFVDGNGRTTRMIMEIELEKNNIFPFIPYDNEKREYQQAMSKFSLEAQCSLLVAYDNFGDYIVKNYERNVREIVSKLKKMEKLK